jgi:hypothetical protein
MKRPRSSPQARVFGKSSEPVKDFQQPAAVLPLQPCMRADPQGGDERGPIAGSFSLRLSTR